MQHPRIHVLTAFCIALFFVHCGSGNKKEKIPAGAAGKRPTTLTVEGHIVSRGTISQPLQLPGTLIPMEETELHPEIAGRVVSLQIKEGTYVSKGTLLVKLFDGDLQAQLKKLKVQLQIAEKTEERNKELLKISGISQQDYDLSFLQVNNIKADIELLETNIEKTELRAPYSGRIGFKNISLGAYVTPATIVTTLRDVKNLKLEFSVPEQYSALIKTGQRVGFTVAGSNRKHFAQLYATEAAVTATTRSLQVRGMVQAGDPQLIPGAFAKVDMDFARDENALLIPSQAILAQARGKKVVVYRDGKAVFADIQTGVRDSAYVQVLEGLKAGDTIITTGLLGIRPDAEVKLSKVQ